MQTELLNFLIRARPSLPAEGNLEPEDDVELDRRRQQKGRKTEDAWSMSQEFIFRHHEEHSFGVSRHHELDTQKKEEKQKMRGL